MRDAQDHYDKLLAAVYVWMAGGFDVALDRYTKFFADSTWTPRGSALAVDLGAGPGFQSIPLADRGYRVIAIDTSQALLDELSARKEQRNIEVVCDDMSRFRARVDSPIELIVCMTDTLLHLGSKADVSTLFQQAFEALQSGGRLVLTFRDLSRELLGTDRIFQVRSDESRIFTCFLEYEPEHVVVHDLLHTKSGNGWHLAKSAYKKLRLDPDDCTDLLRQTGFSLAGQRREGGMVVIIAQKP